MASNQPAQRERGVPLAPLLIGIGVTVAIVIAILVANHFAEKPRGRQMDSYAAQLQIDGIRVLTADTMMAGQVTYVDGTLHNNGDRPLTALTVSFTFRDAMGQVVQSERHQIVTDKTGPLPAHSTQDFRVGFDHISRGWNQTPPAIKPATVFVE